MKSVPAERQDTAESLYGNHNDTVVDTADTVTIGTDGTKQEKYYEKPDIDKALIVRFSVLYSQKETAEGTEQPDDKQGNRRVIQGRCIRNAAVFEVAVNKHVINQIFQKLQLESLEFGGPVAD